MKEKKHAKEDELKFQSYKKLFNIQIIEIIFSTIFLFIIYLRFINIININKSLFANSMLLLLIYAIIIIIICIIYMIKYTKNEKIFAKKIVVSFFTIILLGFLSFEVDNSFEMRNFLKDANKTIGDIYNITSEIKYEKDNCPGERRLGNECCPLIRNTKLNCYSVKDYYQVYYTYYVNYFVNDVKYSNEFEIHDLKKYRVKDNAVNSISQYNHDKQVTVFYNKYNPKDSRIKCSVFPDILVYIFGAIIILIQLYSFIKLKKNN